MVFVDDIEYKHERTLATLPRTVRGVPLVITAKNDGSTLLYTNGNSVVMRNVQNPAESELYTEHSHATTCARYAPSGFYIASGDSVGKLRIWDTTQTEHILKAEYPVISGPIRDIAWSPDSKRIAVVGEGKDRFGHVLLFDTGTSNGSLSGQSKAMTALDWRPQRPFRIVSTSEDFTTAIFEGPPFKFKNALHQHSRFALCVKYEPVNGAHFVSGGADGKIFIYEGTDGGVTGELVDASVKTKSAHAGGVYAVCFTPDGQRLLSASGDKTTKLWNMADQTLIATFATGTTVDDQQLGCVCAGDELISVSLSGSVNYWDAAAPQTPKMVINGHARPITALTLAADANTLFTADSEGHLCRWDLGTGACVRLTPKVHTAQIVGLSVGGDGRLTSVAWDDNAASIDAAVTAAPQQVQARTHKLASQPRGVARNGKWTVIVCQKEVVAVDDAGQTKGTWKLPAEGNCVAMCPTCDDVAIGANDSKVHLLRIDPATGALSHERELTMTAPVVCAAYSADGKYFVACDSNRRVVPYSTACGQEYTPASKKEWTFHTARPQCVAWSPDNRRLATGALDTHIIVWDVLTPNEHPLIIKGAHPMSHVTGIVWLSDTRLVSTGHDSCIKTWTVNAPQTP